MSASRTMVSSGSEFESAVGYSRAVRIGPLVVVAGTTGSGDDIAAQTRDALRRIEIALGQAGATLADVVRTRIHVTDISLARGRRSACTGFRQDPSGDEHGRGYRADCARPAGRDRGRRLRRVGGCRPKFGSRPEGPVTSRWVGGGPNHSAHRQWAVEMREKHRPRISRHARLPTHG